MCGFKFLMMEKTFRILLFFCLFLLLGYACGDDDDTGTEDDTSANNGGDGSDVTPEVLDRDGDGIEECTDLRATNYREDVSPEEDDCSCVYEGFEKLSVEKEIVAYRNVFVEMITGTWCPSCGSAKNVIEKISDLEEARGYGGEVTRLVEMYVDVDGPGPQGKDRLASISTMARSGELLDFLFPGRRDYSTPQVVLNYDLVKSPLAIGPMVENLRDFPVLPKAVIGIESHVDGRKYSALLSFRFLNLLASDEPTRYKTFLVEGELDEYQAGLGEYTHHNVLREEVVMAKGVIVSSVALAMGGVYTRYFEHDVKDIYDISHCSLVVVLYQSPVDGEFPPNAADFEYINVSSAPVGKKNVW